MDWAIRIVYLVILAWAWLIYLDIKPWNKIGFGKLIRGAIAFKIGYAVAATIAQYSIWSKGELTRIFLTSHSAGIFNFKGGYFIFYTLNRFWAGMVLGVLMAWLFYKFLLFLKKYEDRFLGEGEAELGFLTALLVGWPDFVVYLPLFLVFTILISMVRNIFWKEKYTTLGLPMLLAASAILVFEPYFSRVFVLGALVF
jgi:hypothetical protein